MRNGIPLPSWNLSVKLFRASRVSDLRYEYETWCFSTVRSSYRKKKKKEKKKERKKNRSREGDTGVNEPWTTSNDAKLSDGRSTAVFGIPLRIWRVRKYQGRFARGANRMRKRVYLHRANLNAKFLRFKTDERIPPSPPPFISIEFDRSSRDWFYTRALRYTVVRVLTYLPYRASRSHLFSRMLALL